MAHPWRNPADQPTFGRSVPSDGGSRSATELSRVRGQMEPGKNCAYNDTRGCFMGLHVVAGEFSPPSLLDWISTLRADSGTGIWMIPFRGLPAKEVRTPIDLLYLDSDCRVMEVVELFPTFRVSASCAPAASVLVLPAYSIASSKTEAGDQLLLCPTEEIKWRLEQLAETGSVGAAAVPVPDRRPMRPVLVREVPALPEVESAPESAAAVEPPAPVQQVAEPELAAPKTEGQRPEKPWMSPGRQPVLSAFAKLGRWLLPEPRDPRKVMRKPVQGLVAHFFTGGAPQAHEIRDVSATGLYVVTGERWYPGTIIRMTLSKPDTGQAPSDRSITVQTRAVRWGNDGVGLEFLVEQANSPGPGNHAALGGVSGKQLERFLKGIVNLGR